MNTQNRCLVVLTLALAAVAGAPAAHAEMRLSVDCADRALPSQAAVAQGLGIANLDQAYQARVRLASVVNRACRHDGRRRVELVLRPAPAPNLATVRVAKR
jgi:hypothetical protein